MKLDVNMLRYLSRDEFRVLTAVEMGQKNHEIVPLPLIDSISGLKHGGAARALSALLRHKLVHHDGARYDGYRLTYQGYDYLALRALAQRGSLVSVGRQVGVGKEADVFEALGAEGEPLILKVHRLGRTSFRDVASKRDYLGRRSSYSWLYLSRLAALKEHAFMAALHDRGFPVPKPIDHSRHAVLMTRAKGLPLAQVRRVAAPRAVFTQAMALLERLASVGLVHCDFNEFNLLVAAPGEDSEDGSTEEEEEEEAVPEQQQQQQPEEQRRDENAAQDPPSPSPSSSPSPSQHQQQDDDGGDQGIQHQGAAKAAPKAVAPRSEALAAALAEAAALADAERRDWDETGVAVPELTLIDFPQMVSVRHPNARELFDRDVDSVVRFFAKKLGYVPERDPKLPAGMLRASFDRAVALADEGEAEAAAANGGGAARGGGRRPKRGARPRETPAEGPLDAALAASGFRKQHQDALEAAFAGEDAAVGEEEEEEEESDDDAETDDDDNDEDDEGSEGGGDDKQGVSAAAAALGRAGLSAGKDDEEDGSSSSSDDDDDDADGAADQERPQRKASAAGKKGRRGGAGDAGAADDDAAARRVQAKLVAQSKRDAKRAETARASRNSNKARTRTERKAAAAIAGGGGFW